MEKEQNLEDPFVRRVIECLRVNSFKRRSLEEITKEYNQKYPPSMVNRIVGNKVDTWKMEVVLEFLVIKKLLVAEMLTYTDRPLKEPVRHYWLTEEGKRFFNPKK